MPSVRSLARHSAQTALKHGAHAFDVLRTPARGAVVLIYHRVGAGSGLEVDLPVERFAEQMAALRDGARATTLDAAIHELDGQPPSGPDPVVVTFDDGTADFVDAALPVLVEFAIPALLYVATDFVDTGRSFPDDGSPVSWAGLRDAVSTGLVEVGSHTHTHALLDRLDPAAVSDELDRSVDRIEDELARPARHFAYPKALVGSAAAQAAVRQRFATAAVAGTRANPYGATDPYLVARSPVQVADEMRWFQHKVQGGMRLEDDIRQVANRVRYRGATT